MRPSRCLVSAALLIAVLLCLVVIGAAVLWSAPPGGYRGTIYFADRYGVWKMRFPELEPVLLVSQELFDPWSLRPSPDPKLDAMFGLGECRQPTGVITSRAPTKNWWCRWVAMHNT